tara:strand:- start:621 stop:839 length:219 start_codon:yes stop_codon:yes gene_type:complete
MQKIKKIEIKVNGKVKFIPVRFSILDLVKNLKIPIKKVAIELNQEIMDKKKINRIILKKNDKIEIVHFIGGG